MKNVLAAIILTLCTSVVASQDPDKEWTMMDIGPDSCYAVVVSSDNSVLISWDCVEKILSCDCVDQANLAWLMALKAVRDNTVEEIK